jgi:hypothetical protein
MIGRPRSRNQVTGQGDDMTALADEYRSVLLGKHEPPCLSLYQPTHRQQPDRRQDPIRYKNLVKALEESVERDYATRDARPLLAPFHALLDDHAFWNHGQDGLAVLGTADMFRVYRLQRTVPERAIVADSFHTKPLLRILQSADRFHVLALNRREACLFEGNRDALARIDIAPGIERMVTDLPPGEADAERATRVYSTALGAPTTRHGTDVTQDVVDHDTDRFFRLVDQAVIVHHSRATGLPLLLAALPEYHHRFRAISENHCLAPEALDVYAGDLSLDETRERAWRLMLPRYLHRLAALSDTFQAAKARSLATDDVGAAAQAAVAGRVATLLVEADRMIPGRIDAATGKVALGDLDNPAIDDVLDDLGEQVLRTGGEVVVVPADRMPTSTGAAATYRY